MQNTNLNPGQSVTIGETPVDPNLNPGAVGAGINVWNGPDPTSTGLTIVASTDGLSAVATATATAVPGVYNVTVTGQNPAGFAFSSVFTVTIVQQPATSFVFTFGTPVG